MNPNLQRGDIDLELLAQIAPEIPPGVVVQFHRDGEPLVYPYLDAALKLFRNNFRSIVTNGKKLYERRDEIEGNCESITVSVFARDPEWEEQDAALVLFHCSRRAELPRLWIKVVGEIEERRSSRWLAYGIPMIHRTLHIPHGSRKYRGDRPPVPEHGVCADLLHHPSIDWQGNVYLCNRLDTTGAGQIGNLASNSLAEILAGEKREHVIRCHTTGRRNLVSPCDRCEFYGLPAG